MDIELNRKTRLHKLGAAVGDDLDFFSNESYPQLDMTPKEMAGAEIDETYPDYVFGVASTVQAETRLFYAPTSEMKSGKMNWKVLCKISDNIVRGYAPRRANIYTPSRTQAL